MKPQATLTLAVILGLATPALAQSTMDADGDGNVTFEEVQAVLPDMTDTVFVTLDTDGDGVLSKAEFAAAIDAGLLPS